MNDRQPFISPTLQSPDPLRLNPNYTFNINLKTDRPEAASGLPLHCHARLAGQIRFCLIHASRPTDRPSDRPRRPSERTLLCLSEVQLELGSRPQRGRTDGRTDGRLDDRARHCSFLLQVVTAAARARRRPCLPSNYSAALHLQRRQKRIDGSTFTVPSLHPQRSAYIH